MILLEKSLCALTGLAHFTFKPYASDFRLELTWLRDHTEPYDLGEQEYHLAFVADDFEAAHKKHSEMGVICFENPSMGIYFLEDPDGYWIEIIPPRK